MGISAKHLLRVFLTFAFLIALSILTGLGSVDAAENESVPSPTIKPNPLNFPAQSFPATSEGKTVEVSNPPSGSAITFSNIDSTQPDFVVTGGTCKINEALAPGHSCTILVTFKPVQAGHRQATLFVEWGGNKVKVKVHLSGVANAKLSML
jgi:hypothetical protein